eukprot:9658858-Ditylum_brightwellii.AAC.1
MKYEAALPPGERFVASSSVDFSNSASSSCVLTQPSPEINVGNNEGAPGESFVTASSAASSNNNNNNNASSSSSSGVTNITLAALSPGKKFVASLSVDFSNSASSSSSGVPQPPHLHVGQQPSHTKVAVLTCMHHDENESDFPIEERFVEDDCDIMHKHPPAFPLQTGSVLPSDKK